jgi:hypothetical protein
MATYVIIYSMSKSYEQILREAGNAVDYVRSLGGEAPWSAVDEQTASGTSLRDFADSDILHGLANTLPLAPPNKLRASTVEEFAMIYSALGYVQRCKVDPQKVAADICHETDHKARVDFVGFEHSAFSLTLVDSRVRQIDTPAGPLRTVEFAWRAAVEAAGPLGKVTKLALASIAAAPHKLSDGDAACLNAMGYTGQQDVANRIMSATDPRLSSLPLPGPFSSF